MIYSKQRCFDYVFVYSVVFAFYSFLMCLHSGGGFAIFVRKIEIAQGVSFYKFGPDKEKKFFIFFTNSKIVVA